MKDQISLQLLFCLPIAILLSGLLLALGGYVAVRESKPDGLAGLAVAGVLIAFTLSVTYPWKHDYHYWSEKSGTIQRVSAQVKSDDGKISQTYVIRFTKNGVEYTCSDARCGLTNVGDSLSLSCMRSWEYAAKDTWQCKYISSKEAD